MALRRDLPVAVTYLYAGTDLAKEELLTVDGTIDEILPDGRFGVTLENQHRIIAYTAG